MANELKENEIIDKKSIKPIDHHSLKQIFDGLHDNMTFINYALKQILVDEEISDSDKDQICDSVNKMRHLLIELECDFSF
ncbi:MAG: hypothetical protein FK730_13010 [Asgard group archaeon]|nr:hypothetical protein [Asgard group archaeon]